MSRVCFTIVCVLVLFVSINQPAQCAVTLDEEGIMLTVTNGWLTNPNVTSLFPDRNDSNSMAQLRPYGLFSISENVSIETAVQTDLSYDSRKTGLLTLPNHSDFRSWRHPGLSWRFRNDDESPREIEGDVACDRLILHVTCGKTDIAIGRQAVNWTGMLFLGTNDLFHPFSAQETERTFKPGIDAIRVTHALGALTEFELCGVAGYNAYTYDWNESAAACRMVTTVSDLHLEVLGGWYLGHRLIGVACQGELGQIGVRCEGNWLDADSSTSDSARIQAAFGMDYHTSHGMHFVVEYLYREDGATDPDDYVSDLMQSASESMGFLSRHYVLTAVDYELHPLVRLDGSILYNALDESGQLAVNTTVSLADETDLIAGLTYPFGEEVVVGRKPGDIPVRLRSEFGIYPSVFHIELRVFL